MRPSLIRTAKGLVGVEINIYSTRSKGLENGKHIFKGTQSAVSLTRAFHSHPPLACLVRLEEFRLMREGVSLDAYWFEKKKCAASV